MMIKLKNVIKVLKYKLLDLFVYREKDIRLDWYFGSNNFGDILNPVLLNKLTGKKPVNICAKYYSEVHYFFIGSILDRANGNTIVWGTGFISQDSNCTCPKKIYAVRGPKTRKILLEQGIECPEIYGDPALLLPKIYKPKIDKKYKIGIIPHYVDKNNPWLDKYRNNDDINIIDIQVTNPFSFIDEVLCCEKIISSSLHGIIVSDAYNIPSMWIEFSDKVIGNGFKFIDYFMSVKRVDTEPIKIDDKIDILEIYSKFYKYKIEIDLESLIDSCPFEIKLGK